MNAHDAESDSHDAGVLSVRSGDLIAFDHHRGEIRVVPSEQFAAEAVHALPRAQQAAREASLRAEDLRVALCNLWRAILEDDFSDCDEARIQDALDAAQRLAPYEPEEPDEHGF